MSAIKEPADRRGWIAGIGLGAEVDRFANTRVVHTTIRTEAFTELRSAFIDVAPRGDRARDV